MVKRKMQADVTYADTTTNQLVADSIVLSDGFLRTGNFDGTTWEWEFINTNVITHIRMRELPHDGTV